MEPKRYAFPNWREAEQAARDSGMPQLYMRGGNVWEVEVTRYSPYSLQPTTHRHTLYLDIRGGEIARARANGEAG